MQFVLKLNKIYVILLIICGKPLIELKVKGGSIVIVVKALLYIILILLLLIFIVIITPVGASVKYSDGKSDIYLHIGLLRLNTAWFKSKKPKIIKVKKKSLKKLLAKKSKSQVTPPPDKTKAQVLSKSADVQKSSHDFTDKTPAFQSNDANDLHKDPCKKQDFSSTPSKDNTSFIKKLASSLKNAEPYEILDLINKCLCDVKDPLAKHTRVKIKSLTLCVSTPDADKTAVLYGVACMALDSLLDVAEGFFTFKINRKSCHVTYDFLKGKSTADACVKFTLTPFGLLISIFRIFKNLKHF